MGNTDNYVQIMMDSLVMKKSVLEKIVALNEDQKGIVSSEEFDGNLFRDNVNKKAELVEEINRLDAGFDDLFRRVREVLDENKALYSSQITTMKALIKDVTELAVKVEADEARNKRLVEKKFAELRKGVQTAKTNVQKTNTYYQNMNKLDTAPQFMDQKK